MKEIKFYECKYYMFSNFSAFGFFHDGRDWPTSEHAYQASKFKDDYLKSVIQSKSSPYDAKRIAHELANEGKQKSNWDEIKIECMYSICSAKLAHHEIIREALLETEGKEIIETSPMDSFWGWGPNKDGRNELGKIWMRLRDDL